MLRTLTVAALVLTASAASAAYTPNYTYNSIMVVNDSEATISGFMVEDTRHGSKHQCGSIAPSATCTIWFGSRSYQENTLRVSWAHGDAGNKSEELMLDVPVSLATGPVLRGVITIGSDGMLSSRADQPARR